ncbi:basic amino acid ABC transporter substrate-binding protein [Haloarchaeobius sp. TZWWS8]|uniref:basic amino acid ABC transporter substrate-binding protein n=1 Tax=Haloarchaeobius sp. TZWWS8 TaxID=3446121 RepID=UPI003EBEA4AB
MDRRGYLKGTGAAIGSMGLAGCISSFTGGSGGGETVLIGSDIPYKPFEYEKADGTLTGFDVDIAEAVFKGEMGMEYEFKKTAWDGIIPSLNNGNFRVIMSAMTINDERAKKVDFSDPYFTAYQTVLVLKGGDISAKEDLKGKNVGVQRNTTGAGAAEELKEEFGGDLTIKSFDQITGAFDALVNNQVSAVINDNTVNAEFANKNDKVVFLEGDGAAKEAGQEAPPYLTLTVENYGIAFRQDDDDFRKQVNDAIAAIKESGKYDDIYSNYFQG